MAILHNKFVRSDGSVIGSDSIISCKYTASVNSQTNLSLGDATAKSVEVEMRTPVDMITGGETLTYYQIEDGVEVKKGVFYAEPPTISTKTSIRFTAYDGVAKLATDISGWLHENQSLFPISLRTLVEQACNLSGVSFSETTFPHEDMQIPAFYSDGITARHILSWAAQLAASFVECDDSGIVRFSWYENAESTISGVYSADSIQYMQDTLSVEGYTTETIKRVQFKQETDDVGVIYPQDATGNVLSISQNGIAALLSSDILLGIAAEIYEKVKDISYTPLECTVKRTAAINPGEIIQVTDSNGATVTTYVMSVTLDSSGTTISSTGDKSYSDKAAVSSESFKNIPGKILLLRKSVDGLYIEARDLNDNIASILADIEGITTQVSNQEGDITRLKQSADSIDIKVERIISDGVDKVRTSMGYTFDNEGLQISKEGEQIHNRLNHEGMLVARGDEAMLQADKDGVLATDVKVRNYLIIGKHCRIEDYSKSSDSQRTAVFWIPEE